MHFGKIFACFLVMKMTANINPAATHSPIVKDDFQERVSRIVSTKWKLKSIFETGLVTDEAVFKDVDVVFSHFHIYALYGNRVDKFKYHFLTSKTFIVEIEGIEVKCRINEFNEDGFIFHVDFNNSHFIVELEAA